MIIAGYLLLIVGIGVFFVRRIKKSDDYYLAGKSFGPMVLMATVCATIIGGSGLMGRAGVAYSSGFKAVLTAIPYMLGMFIFAGISGHISDLGMEYGISSIPDLFERRFGKVAKIILSVMLAMAMMGTVASQVTATATIISMLGGEIGLSYEIGACIACAVFIIYTATSGLFGVVYTDVMQFYVLLIFVYLMVPIASLINVGGVGNFLANLDTSLVQPYMDGSIAGDIVTYLVFTMAGAEMWQRAFAAKDRKSAKKGMFLGTAVYAVTISLVFFMGIIAHQVIGDDVLALYGSTDAVIPALVLAVLPTGLRGLALAGLLSVIMSTADSYLLVSVQTCVRDIGKTFVPDMKDKTEMRLSRIFAVVLSVGALLIALYFQNAYAIIGFAWSFYAAAAGIPAFAALYWKKVTKPAIIAAMLAGFGVCVGWKLAGQPFGLGASVPGAIACGVVLVVVTFATYKKYPSVYLGIDKKAIKAREEQEAAADNA